MMRKFMLLPFALVLAAASPRCLADARVDTVATFEGGASLQAIDRATDGTLYLTDYAHDSILKVDPRGHVSEFVTGLPIHPQGLLLTHSGFVVSGPVHRASPDTTLTPQERFRNFDGRVLVLDRRGKVVKSIAVGADTFPNGMTWLNHKTILLADSLAGTVWRVDPEAGTVSAWSQDPLLRPEPQFPGANGIKRHGKWLFVSNTSRAQIIRIPIDRNDRPAGAATVFSTAPRVDEMAIMKDGTIYAASHGPMIKVSPTGVQSTVFDAVPGGPTLMVAPDQKSLFVTTDVGPHESGKGPAYVLRLWL
jgi:sugar lactone lactonase YvrE